MKITVQVDQITAGQRDVLERMISERYPMKPDHIRVCVVFSGPQDREDRHAEMSFIDLAALAYTLRHVDMISVIDAGQGKDKVGPVCDHGTPVVERYPSMFDGCPPVNRYADGCGSYGPYTSAENR